MQHTDCTFSHSCRLSSRKRLGTIIPAFAIITYIHCQIRSRVQQLAYIQLSKRLDSRFNHTLDMLFVTDVCYHTYGTTPWARNESETAVY